MKSTKCTKKYRVNPCRTKLSFLYLTNFCSLSCDFFEQKRSHSWPFSWVGFQPKFRPFISKKVFNSCIFKSFLLIIAHLKTTTGHAKVLQVGKTAFFASKFSVWRAKFFMKVASFKAAVCAKKNCNYLCIILTVKMSATEICINCLRQTKTAVYLVIF